MSQFKHILIFLFSLQLLFSCISDDIELVDEEMSACNPSGEFISTSEIYSQYDNNVEVKTEQSNYNISQKVAWFCGDGCTKQEEFNLVLSKNKNCAQLISHSTTTYRLNAQGEISTLVQEYDVSNFELLSFENEGKTSKLIGRNEERYFELEMSLEL